MIEMIVILGPNFPVNALPNFDLVETWRTGIYYV